MQHAAHCNARARPRAYSKAGIESRCMRCVRPRSGPSCRPAPGCQKGFQQAAPLPSQPAAELSTSMRPRQATCGPARLAPTTTLSLALDRAAVWDDDVDLLLRRALDLQLQLRDVGSRCRAVDADELLHDSKRTAACEAELEGAARVRPFTLPHWQRAARSGLSLRESPSMKDGPGAGLSYVVVALASGSNSSGLIEGSRVECRRPRLTKSRAESCPVQRRASRSDREVRSPLRGILGTSMTGSSRI